VNSNMSTELGSSRVQWLIAWPLGFRWALSRNDSLGDAKAPATSARILIVEDDYLVASETESALIRAGLEVAGIASSGDEALKLAAAERPSLVIMDIRLNGNRDGIDVALDLFATHGIRRIFATAHQTADARKRAEPANPIAWLPKPYTMPALVAVVRSAVAQLHPG
jgi:two-component system, response regulator PdtaR